MLKQRFPTVISTSYRVGGKRIICTKVRRLARIVIREEETRNSVFAIIDRFNPLAPATTYYPSPSVSLRVERFGARNSGFDSILSGRSKHVVPKDKCTLKNKERAGKQQQR